jgi:hypothetical protein
LEEFSMTWGHVGRALALLIAAPLVTLSIFNNARSNQWREVYPDVNHRVICQVIEASSGTLRAVSLCYDDYTDLDTRGIDFDTGKVAERALV